MLLDTGGTSKMKKLTLVFLSSFLSPASAQPVCDVTSPPFLAAGDNRTDDTAALQAGDPQRGTDEQLRAGRESGFLSGPEAETLLAAWRLCWTLRTAGRLLTDRDPGPQGLGQGGCAFLLRETGAETAADLTLRLRVASGAAAAVIAAKLGKEQRDGETGDAVDRS